MGHATTGGKSGRVIEKLMSENDRLKRELREQMTKAEDLQRSMQTYKPRLEALQSENENLSHARSVDHALLVRRDRMVADLKAELATEKERREKFEKLAQRVSAEKDEAVYAADRRAQASEERSLQNQTQRTVLERSIAQLRLQTKSREEARQSHLRNELEPRVKKFAEDYEKQEADNKKRDIVNEQLDREIKRLRALQTEMIAKWAEISEGREERLRLLESQTQEENEKTRKLSVEMDEVVKRMKWVVNVKENTEIDQSIEGKEGRKDSHK